MSGETGAFAWQNGAIQTWSVKWARHTADIGGGGTELETGGKVSCLSRTSTTQEFVSRKSNPRTRSGWMWATRNECTNSLPLIHIGKLSLPTTGTEEPLTDCSWGSESPVSGGGDGNRDKYCSLIIVTAEPVSTRAKSQIS